MRPFFLCVICGFSFHFHLIATSLRKDTTENVEERYTSVIVGSDYSTNTNTFGRFDNFAKQPSFSPYVSYLSKYGFNIGGTAYFIGNSDASGTKTTSELDLQAGYDWILGKVISISPSYTHFFYSSNSSTLKKSYNDYVQLGLNADVKWWNTSISGKYFWGEYNETILTAQTGVNITFDNFLSKGNSLQISPSIEANISNINYFRYISGNFKFLRAYATAYPDATINELLGDLKTNNRPVVKIIAKKISTSPYLQKRLDNLSVDGNLVISDLFSSKKELKVSNIGLTLPVYYYFGNFTMNVVFAAYKPFNQPKLFGNEWTTYFGVGVSYTFGNQGQNSFR